MGKDMNFNETKMDEIIEFEQNCLNEETVRNNQLKIIQSFESKYEEWETCLGFLKNGKQIDHIFANILLAYSASVDDDFLTVNRVFFLKERIQHFENNVEYVYEIKSFLYNNLGNCFAKLGQRYDSDAIESFKNSYFFLLANVNRTIYKRIECFAFHGYSDRFLNNLIDEELSISSPLKFNDIFDCPIIDLLNNNNGPSQLKRDALTQCIKIGCFEKNDFLPTAEELINEVTYSKKSDAEEYRNELLWSHYADNHKGLCVNYIFDSSMTRTDDKHEKIVSFFRDIDYMDNLDSIKHGSSINLFDGFFAKSKAWSYEHELRFLHYDLKGTGEYSSVKIPNSIKSVIFGERCSTENIQKTISSLRGRKYRDFNEDGKEIFKDIEFYQMKKSDDIFGRLEKTKLNVMEV